MLRSNYAWVVLFEKWPFALISYSYSLPQIYSEVFQIGECKCILFTLNISHILYICHMAFPLNIFLNLQEAQVEE